MQRVNMVAEAGPANAEQSHRNDPLPTNVLIDAAQCVFNDRNASYGSPLSDFTCSATMIGAYLNRRFGTKMHLEPYDVAMVLALVKISRMAHAPKYDSLVDLCGYSACASWTLSEQGKPGFTG